METVLGAWINSAFYKSEASISPCPQPLRPDLHVHLVSPPLFL